MSDVQRFGLEQQIGTYGSKLRARLDDQHKKGFGQPGFLQPSEEYVEEQYQKELMQGFQLYRGKGAQRKKVMCQTCFQAYTASGTCGCY